MPIQDSEVSDEARLGILGRDRASAVEVQRV
jgi:hypothetical protein